ncbi:MAG: ATP-binding cassette domain-containing protein [Verrucomicrobiota bacterium]
MIKVKDLQKKYAGFEAVCGISFEVEKGEIVGFLGPNGAGKSTTMRILTGYLPSTAGEIEIGGMNLLSDLLAVRKMIGYMPENVPLYTDMSVHGFLEYRAALKGVSGKELKDRVQIVMKKCGIDTVSKKVISNLSRGYRQRVGLADALVHDPELLILDEPTAGLDPNQIRSVRELIKELGEEHTILLSTHILTEVESVCNRAIIINRGKIEASDTLENLSSKVQGGSLFLNLKGNQEDLRNGLTALSAISKVNFLETEDGWNRFECVSKPGEDACAQADDLIKEKKWPLREFRRDKATLEDVFVELTKE